MRETESPLEDFPLHGGDAVGRPAIAGGPAVATDPVAAEVETPPAAATSGGIASLSTRATAAAADAAVVLLLTASALLAARLATGAAPRPAGLAWAAGFALYLSFFATVPALVLFGKTIGMALAEISARSEAGAGLSADMAARRWLGTLLAAATAGLALLWTRSDAGLPTPADRLSGHALTID